MSHGRRLTLTHEPRLSTSHEQEEAGKQNQSGIAPASQACERCSYVRSSGDGDTADHHRHVRRDALALSIPDALIEAVAIRVIELLDAITNEPERYLDSKQTATYLACPMSRIYALVNANRIPFHRDGSRLLFRASELDAWIASGGGTRP